MKDIGITRRKFGALCAKAGLGLAAYLSGCTSLIKPKPAEQRGVTCAGEEAANEYEYIVVGSGAGGGPLAANLARKGHRVLLVEAGGDNEDDNYKVPLFHPLATEDPAMRWDFFVRHYADDKESRKDKKFSEQFDGVFYPRCSTLGGCTAHNAMILVYPHNSDWDYIAGLTGDSSWSSGNMRPYFERMEHCHYVERPAPDQANPGRHGFAGWLPTSLPPIDTVIGVIKDKQLREILLHSALEALKRHIGAPMALLKTRFDPNDWRNIKLSNEGMCNMPLTTDKGRRAGSREYVREVERACAGKLKVRLNTLVTRVVLDDNNKAVGIEYLEGERLYRADRDAGQDTGNGKKGLIRATREVILSTGAFNTPQLLMLSGIGPKDELEKHGIPVRVDLPGVGKNLQDRYEVTVVTEMKREFSLLQGVAFEGPKPGEEPNALYREWLKGEGVYTTNGAVLSFIKRSASAQLEPDLFIFGMPGFFEGYFPGYSKKVAEDQKHFTWAILKAHTRNTAGVVKLNSRDPRERPYINFHYFDEGNDYKGEDIDALVEGIQFVRSITKEIRPYIEREVVPGEQVRTPEQLKAFAKANAWGHHASCSCKMGRKDDPMAVVDGNFRVYGVKNLRVVDASVFPKIPGFFIVSAVYMIAEKASDVIHDEAVVKKPASIEARI